MEEHIDSIVGYTVLFSPYTQAVMDRSYLLKGQGFVGYNQEGFVRYN